MSVFCDTAISERDRLLTETQGEKTKGEEAKSEKRHYAQEFVYHLMDNYSLFVQYLCEKTWWASATSDIFMSKTFSAKYPPCLWFLMAVMCGCVAMCAPILIPGLAFKALWETMRSAWSQGCSCDWNGFFHFRQILGVLMAFVLLLVSSAAPVLLIVEVFFIDLHHLVAIESISGAVIFGPPMFCFSIGFYTTLQAIEYSSCNLIYTCIDREMMEAFNDSDESLEVVPDMLKAINDNMKLDGEDALFERPQRTEFKNRLDDGWAYYARQTLNANRIAKLTSCPATMVFVLSCSVVQAVIPALWMRFSYGHKYLHEGDRIVKLLVWCAHTSIFVLSLLFVSSSWGYQKYFKDSLVRHLVILLLYSPDASRRFVHGMYKDTYLKDLLIKQTKKDGEDAKEDVKLQDALDNLNTLRTQSFIGARGPQKEKPGVPELKDMVKKTVKRGTGLNLECRDGKGIMMDFSLDIKNFYLLWLWMKVDDLMERNNISAWLHIGIIFTLGLVLECLWNVFYYTKVTSMTLANFYTLLIVAYFLYNKTSFAIWHGRLRRDETDNLLQNWREMIKKQKQTLLDKEDHQRPYTSLDRLVIDNYFRGMLELVQEMNDRTNEIEVPISVFGFTVSTRSLSQGALALGSVLATSLVNFVRESEEAKGMILNLVSMNENETKTE